MHPLTLVTVKKKEKGKVSFSGVVWSGEILRLCLESSWSFFSGGEDFENVIPKDSKAERMNVSGIMFKLYAFWYLMWLFMVWRRQYSLKVSDPLPVRLKRQLFCCSSKNDRLAMRCLNLHFWCKTYICCCCRTTESCTGTESFSSLFYQLLWTNCAGFGKKCLHIGEP